MIESVPLLTNQADLICINLKRIPGSKKTLFTLHLFVSTVNNVRHTRRDMALGSKTRMGKRKIEQKSMNLK
jgi:hypothetical protein